MAKSLISHVGIAVRDLDQAIKQYRILTGSAPELITEVPDQQVRVAIFAAGDMHAGGRVELVAPLSNNSPISAFLEKRGEGLHHICIYVSNLAARLTELREAGCRLIDESPRIGAEGTRIAFIHPSGSSGVLIELEERAPHA